MFLKGSIEINCSFHQATDEQLFQAARRLVAAELQAIAFREYLPALLGSTKHIPPYQGYNKSIDVGISNIMTTAAFRCVGFSRCPIDLRRYVKGPVSQKSRNFSGLLTSGDNCLYIFATPRF